MAYCEESSAFARTMTEFILASKGLSEKDPIQPCLNRVFSILEKNLLQGGLCAEISQNEARSLIKARLALEHPQAQMRNTLRRSLLPTRPAFTCNEILQSSAT